MLRVSNEVTMVYGFVELYFTFYTCLEIFFWIIYPLKTSWLCRDRATTALP